MRKVKKVMASAFLMVLLCMCSVGVYAAEAGCNHNWEVYSRQHVYSKDLKPCTEPDHKNCFVKVDGYFVRWKCSKCGAEKSNTATETLHITMN